ncbi:sulfur carrier protein ThiS [Pseudoclavibacter sp. CFCC 13796]|uniref:sulfur carrier protein ThiS n=1 Tax=Pseudoclavibacter sp. CFCC 13796 TaxID=2615179 RepID=UPI0013014B46|nr:sulfur carrier protein ThiS [Pseudoclavibacter sp. CFCC 13796]KAB1661466.1 sulfur carrier protein ThiS [Pseudoclavibacter sp. CFCC 13796]
MTQIILNGEAVETEADSVLALVAERTGTPLAADGRPVDGSRLGVAVAVDETIVPRGRWAQTVLTPQARIELVTAKQGG